MLGHAVQQVPMQPAPAATTGSPAFQCVRVLNSDEYRKRKLLRAHLSNRVGRSFGFTGYGNSLARCRYLVGKLAETTCRTTKTGTRRHALQILREIHVALTRPQTSAGNVESGPGVRSCPPTVARSASTTRMRRSMQAKISRTGRISPSRKPGASRRSETALTILWNPPRVSSRWRPCEIELSAD